MASTVLSRQWVFLGAALLLIGSVIGWNLYTYRNAIEAGEREHLAHQAKVIEENLSKQLLATNRALESIRRDLPLLKAQKDSKVLINSRLQAMSDTMPGVRTLFIFDADATVIASNRKELIGLNFREREYYKTARQSRNPTMLHLSQPYKTVLGAFAMTLVKVIPDKRGGGAGMVGATIDPEYFKILLASVRYAPDMWTSLAHGDGKLFLFVPERPGTEGVNLAQPGGLFIRHRDSGQMATVMTGLVLVTGEERMIAQRTIKPADVLMDKVIFVAVARDLPTIFAVWRRSAVVESGVFGLLVLITALGLYLYQKSQRAYERIGANQETERKKTEEALRESEERYRTVVSSADAGIIFQENIGIIRTWNTAAERIFGISAEEALGQTSTSRDWKTYREDGSELKGAEHPSMHTLATGEPCRNIVMKVVRATGGFSWINVNTSPIFKDGDSKPSAVVITFSDISERKQADEKLRESEERLRLALQAANQGLYDLNVQTGAAIVNREYAQMLGYDPETFIETNAFWIERLHPDDHEITAKAYSDYLNGLTSEYRIEFRQKTIDGHWKWLLSLGKIVGHDADGKPLRMLGTHTDITERKQVEQALQESETKYRLLLRNIRVAVIVHGSDTRILISNPMAQELLGLTENQMLGKTVIDPDWHFLHEDSSIMPLEEYPVNKTLTERRSLKDLIVGIHRTDRDALTWVLVNTEPTLNEQGAIDEVIVTFLDITERKQVEEEKRNLEERLHNTEKMEMMGKLAGRVAHDLNNVLGVLSGYSELLTEKIRIGNPLREFAVTIMKSSGKAAAIVEDLLTLTRRGVRVMEVAKFNKIIGDLLATPELDKLLAYHPNVIVKTDLAKDLLNISGSPVHIEKTVMNLLSNAVEAIVGGGEVNIKTENRYIDKAIEGYQTVAEGEYVVLTVSDTGKGIPATEVKNIFEPFYTKKSMGRSGTGLGLAIVWGAVQDHNGYIDVQSIEGKGTTFTLYFPATREKAEEEAQRIPMQQYTGHGESVLVVDDVQEQREVATTLLKQLGYSVNAVSSGEAAVEYLKSNKADILVLDMIMEPGIDGLDTYKLVLEINPLQKAIIVSGFSETDRTREAQKLGAGTYVKKPYRMEKIGMAIRDELARK